jgi:hypothetical protein
VWKGFGDEHRAIIAELGVHMTDVFGLVGIGDVLAVPGGENITLPIQ